jgi:hypothetical protein
MECSMGIAFLQMFLLSIIFNPLTATGLKSPHDDPCRGVLTAVKCFTIILDNKKNESECCENSPFVT